LRRGQRPRSTYDHLQSGSIDDLVCGDRGLSGLGRELAEVYAAALKNAGNAHPPVLKAEQRGWFKGRNAC